MEIKIGWIEKVYLNIHYYLLFMIFIIIKGGYTMQDELSNVRVYLIQNSNHHLNMLNPS